MDTDEEQEYPWKINARPSNNHLIAEQLIWLLWLLQRVKLSLNTGEFIWFYSGL
jgi:hypothetical protein